MTKTMFVLLSTFAASGVAAQGAYDYAANCRAWPAVQGPHPIGTVEFEVTDSLRSAQYAPRPTPARRLYVRAWYPAGSVAGIEARPYFTAAEAGVLPGILLPAMQQPGDALRGCAQLETNSHTGATPAAGAFPVVSFNHGYTSYPAQQTALFEHLAANGYVVLTIGHPYESGGLVYPNGDAVTLSPVILQDLMTGATASSGMVAHFGERVADRIPATTEYLRTLRKGSLGQLAPVWQSDVYFVLDRLEERVVPEAAKPLAGAIDHTRRAYMGMSYGGYVAGMLAQGDARARAAINLDGGNWTYELVDTDLRTPFLMLNSDATIQVRALMKTLGAVPGVYTGPVGPQSPTAGDLAYEKLSTAGSRGDVYRIVVPGLQHLGVSDFGELLGVPSGRQALGEPAVLKRFTTIQNDLVRGFLDRHVKGMSNGFPAPVLKTHPDLILRDRSDIRRQAAALKP